MNERWLIFERPKGALCWTQTVGGETCYGYLTEGAARAVANTALKEFTEMEFYIVKVELPE